jgi:DHA2 family multidrug resistance protein
MAPVGLLSILLAPVVGRNLQRFDPRAIATIGFVVFALVFFMRSHFTTTIDTWTLTLPSYIQGVAMATYFSSLTLMAFQGVSAERLPLAAGLNGFARTLCIAFSTSIATTAWDVRSTFHHARLMESAHPYNPVFTSEMARLNVAQLEPGQNYSAFEHLASVQASMLGANDVFWFSTILFLVLAALLWIAKPAAQSNRTSH